MDWLRFLDGLTKDSAFIQRFMVNRLAAHPHRRAAMSSKHSIQGKVVLIAGGAKNLGGLIARDLAHQGAQAVAIHYNSAASRADAEATAAAVEKAGARALALQGDLTSAGAVEKLFADTVAAF